MFREIAGRSDLTNLTVFDGLAVCECVKRAKA